MTPILTTPRSGIRCALSALLLSAMLTACGTTPDPADVEADSTAEATGQDDTMAISEKGGATGEASGQTASAAPPESYIDRGVCPFECCVYQEWLAREPLTVYRTEGDTTETAFTIEAGEEFEGVTGNVHIDPVGIAVTTDTVTYGPPEDIDRLPPGDTLYVLSHVGEAAYNMWHDGEIKEIYAFWSDAGIEPGGAKGELLREPEAEWWAQVRNQDGETGWLLMDTIGGKIGRIDSCAGPE